MQKILFSLCIAMLFITGCTKHSEDIEAHYVPPSLYKSYDCEQIYKEKRRIERRVRDFAGYQDLHANKSMAGAGASVFFWPAAILLIGDDKEEEIARLKGEYEALEVNEAAKQCISPDFTKEDAYQYKIQRIE